MKLSTKEQVRLAREKAMAVSARGMVVLVVQGKDRGTWLNGLVTCDVLKTPPGEAVYGLAVAPKGRILTDLAIVVGADRLWLVVPSQVAESLQSSLDQHLVMEDAAFERVPDLQVWFVHGPESGAARARLEAQGAHTAIFDRTGLGGAIVLGPATLDLGVPWGDADGWRTLRLECGIPEFGEEFDATMYPQEASLEKTAVSFSKGCYLGQEVVCMLEMRGHVKRKLLPFVLDGEDVPEAGAPVTDQTAEAIGTVASAAASPTLGKVVGLSMIKYAHARPGVLVRIGSAEGRLVERPV